MIFSFISRIIQGNINKRTFIIFLFLLILITRSHTLFIDYYNPDELSAIVQTNEWLSGEMPGIDFHESKGPVFHAIYKLVFSVFGKNAWWQIHAATIIIIFITALFIAGISNQFRDKSGYIAATLYAIFISAFYKDFPATNGEVVFNLFLAGGFYFFMLYETKKRLLIFLLISAIFQILASMVKFHANFMLLFYFGYYTIIKPYINGTSKKYFYKLLYLIVIIGFILIIDIFLLQIISPFIIHALFPFINYMLTYKSSFMHIIMEFTSNMLKLITAQAILWIAFAIYFYNIKESFSQRDKNKLTLFLLFIVNFTASISTLRFYYHYFIQIIWVLSIIGGIVIHEKYPSINKKAKGIIHILIIVPAILWLIFYYYFVFQKHFNKNYTNTLNLAVPHKKITGVIKWIKEHSIPQKTKIFVWGNTPAINYFTNTRMGGISHWCRAKAHAYIEFGVKDGVIKVLNSIKKEKPEIFVDSAPANYRDFGRYKLHLFPELYTYITNNYTLITNIDGFDIYIRK